jgi:hypothetical protein
MRPSRLDRRSRTAPCASPQPAVRRLGPALLIHLLESTAGDALGTFARTVSRCRQSAPFWPRLRHEEWRCAAARICSSRLGGRALFAVSPERPQRPRPISGISFALHCVRCLWRASMCFQFSLALSSQVLVPSMPRDPGANLRTKEDLLVPTLHGLEYAVAACANCRTPNASRALLATGGLIAVA